MQDPGFLSVSSSPCLKCTFEWVSILYIQPILLDHDPKLRDLDYLLSRNSRTLISPALLVGICKAGQLMGEQPKRESSLAGSDYCKVSEDRLSRLPQPAGQQLSNEAHDIPDVINSRAKTFTFLNHRALESTKVLSLQGLIASPCLSSRQVVWVSTDLFAYREALTYMIEKQCIGKPNVMNGWIRTQSSSSETH